MFLRLLSESARFAYQALVANPLRTLLSLLGVTIGIFAIVAVFTAVDSLERSIRQSVSFLGDKVLYVQKWPWTFAPGYPWWRYMGRPVVNERDFEFLERNSDLASAMAIMAYSENRTFKAGSNSLDGGVIRGISFKFNKVSDVPLRQGRYFTEGEVNAGRPVAIVGVEICDALFPGQRAMGKQVAYRGKRFTIIGIMERQGKSLIGTPVNDNTVIIPYRLFVQVQKVGKGAVEPMVMAKAMANDPDLMGLEDQLRMRMRSLRSLKPVQEDNFAINRPEMVQGAISGIFVVVTLAGGLIGSFSVLVGGFGIANIMFVSVKERTSIIGIQKSLGAKRYFILFQFLVEAVFLSLAGGALGLGLVFICTLIPQDYFELTMKASNFITGITISVIIGLIAGIAPAYAAARMNPVDAIRAN